MSTYLYPYKAGSQSASSLASVLDIKRIKTRESRFKGSEDKTVINWGSTSLNREVNKCNIINPVSAVKLCSNKRTFFEHITEYNMSGEGATVNIPDYTTGREVAQSWIDSGCTVFGRESLSGSGGDGISIYDPSDQISDDYPLYVKYIPKRQEYRAHVVDGEVICVQRKALPEGMSRNPRVFMIRNTSNGFIFARNEGHTPPEQVQEQALAAIAAIPNLTFGAVDIIWNEYRNKAYVLEINTAPGLEGQTLEDYSEAFRRIL